MNPLLKLALEIGPLAVFFIVFGQFKPEDGLDPALKESMELDALLWATGAFMGALLVSLGIGYAMTKELSRTALLTTAVVLVMGALTILLRSDTFIKLKPTLLYAGFAAVLGYGLWRGKSYLKFVLGETLPMREEGWMTLTRNWTFFFLFMAVLNEAVWRTQDTEMWVWVKTFVYLPIVMIFAIAQAPLMARHAIEEEKS